MWAKYITAYACRSHLIKSVSHRINTRHKLVRQARRPRGELEGGAAGPKAPHLKKSPPQAPPEALPEGGLPKAKNLGRSTPCGSDASTRATSADTNAASEATTPRGRILNTEVAT